jgi:hypothetical protein
MKKILVLSSLFALFTIAASAQRGNDLRQQHRIHRGVHTGQLTRAEKFKLNKNQANYRHAKHKAFRDGRLTPMEKRRLFAMKQHNRRETMRYLHNDRKRVF